MKVFLICFLLICGCSSVTYTKDKDGVEIFKYSRFGNQKINGFEANIKKDGTMKIKLKGQEGSAGDLAEMGKNLSEVLLKIP